MNASLAGIYDRGILEKERVHFRANVDLDLSFYVLLDTVVINQNQVTATNLSAYWFPPQKILRGQHVVVYTRAGTATSETRPDGTQYHFLFRALAHSLYPHLTSCAVLVEVSTWATTTTVMPPLAPLPPLGVAPLSSLLDLYNPTAADARLFESLGGSPTISKLLNPKS